MEIKCHCGSGKSLDNCCLPLIERKQLAVTAQELMRSRYTAYVLGVPEYILNTTHVSERKNYSSKSIEEWATSSNWQKLEVLSRTLGGEKDDRGEVEFKAYYTNSKGELLVHHENSTFVKENGEWFFLRGVINPKPVSSFGKTNRNDPCPCGSGLKYKKCCGS